MHPPRIERLKVERYRALRDIDIKAITPLTVLVGPNGSGKSTVFDVLAFLSECFTATIGHPRGGFCHAGRAERGKVGRPW